MDIFRYDSDLMQAISRIADLAWLNILCFICSIPVFTFGASVTAKYYTAMKLERGEAVGVTKTFFHSFKQNFVQDLKITFILMLVYAFFITDWLIAYRSGLGGVVMGMLCIFSAMFMVITFCIFPMISRFEMKTFDAFRNALVFGIVHLPRVILGIFMTVIPFVISFWYIKWAWLIWLFVACVALYYNSRFFIKHFDKLEERMFGPKEPVEEDPDYVEEESEENIEDESKDESEEADASEENEEPEDSEESEEPEEIKEELAEETEAE